MFLSGFNKLELVGILAGVFIFASFIPKKQTLIRIINFFGCVCFVIYGALMALTQVGPLWSVIAINSSLAILQVVYLTITFVKARKTVDKNLYELEMAGINSLIKDNQNEVQVQQLNQVKNSFIATLQSKDEAIAQLKEQVKKLKDKKGIAENETQGN